jgi:amidohydrolase
MTDSLYLSGRRNLSHAGDFFSTHRARYESWRRDLHAHPEIAFEEIRTSSFVAQTLKLMGYEVYEGIAQTGVVAVLRCARGLVTPYDGAHDHSEKDPHHSDKGPESPPRAFIPAQIKARSPIERHRRIGLRADMDALPMAEEGDPPHRSQHDGKMHACGHDGHTVMLLAAAEYMIEHPPTDYGEVVFIFQPAEENLAGGRVMVDEGLFEAFDVDEVFGLHNLPGAPFGEMMARVGPQMASADFFEVTLSGVGGHAAWPHACSDVILAAAQLIQGWQGLVSRGVDPLKSAVLSVTQIHGGESDNVSPSQVSIRGTVRALDEEVRQGIEVGMKRYLDALCQAHDINSSWRYDHRYAVTENAPEQTQRALRAASRVVGQSRIHENTPPLMGAEDFGWMLRARSGCYILLGAGDSPMLHHPKYDFNDDLISLGAQYWVSLCLDFFGAPKSVNQVADKEHI